MSKLSFQSNIACNGCLSKVQPFLDSLEGIESWKVNLETPDKILTVETTSCSAEEIEQAVASAGYKLSKQEED
jgi:copper chaperone